MQMQRSGSYAAAVERRVSAGRTGQVKSATCLAVLKWAGRKVMSCPTSRPGGRVSFGNKIPVASKRARSHRCIARTRRTLSLSTRRLPQGTNTAAMESPGARVHPRRQILDGYSEGVDGDYAWVNWSRARSGERSSISAKEALIYNQTCGGRLLPCWFPWTNSTSLSTASVQNCRSCQRTHFLDRAVTQQQNRRATDKLPSPTSTR